MMQHLCVSTKSDETIPSIARYMHCTHSRAPWIAIINNDDDAHARTHHAYGNQRIARDTRASCMHELRSDSQPVPDCPNNCAGGRAAAAN